MSTKERLIEAGLRVIETEGAEALNARKLAAEIGASTTTVYTHFGGMAGLYEALVRQTFIRFGEALTAVERTDDPVVDLLTLGVAYREFALASPQRYRLMFGVTGLGSGALVAQDLTAGGAPSGLAEATATFDQLREAVQRALDAGRIHGDDATAIAGQFWSTIHGFVLLEMSGFFGTEGHGVTTVLAPHAENLLIGLGDDPEKAREATRRILEWAASRADAAPMPALAADTHRPIDVRRGRRPRPRT